MWTSRERKEILWKGRIGEKASWRLCESGVGRAAYGGGVGFQEGIYRTGSLRKDAGGTLNNVRRKRRECRSRYETGFRGPGSTSIRDLPRVWVGRVCACAIAPNGMTKGPRDEIVSVGGSSIRRRQADAGVKGIPWVHSRSEVSRAVPWRERTCRDLEQSLVKRGFSHGGRA